jgi:hypothetical protein
MATSLNRLPPIDPDSGGLNVVVDTPKGSVRRSIASLAIAFRVNFLGGAVSTEGRGGRRALKPGWAALPTTPQFRRPFLSRKLSGPLSPSFVKKAPAGCTSS